MDEHINKNLKKTGIINIIIILATIALRLSKVGSMDMLATINACICSIALAVGVIYAITGYKKTSAKYYKIYMFLYLVSCIIALIAPFDLLSRGLAGLSLYLNIFCCIAIVVCIGILSFGKNLGKDKSINLSYTVLAISTVESLILLLDDQKIFTPLDKISTSLSYLLLAIILILFVSAKYADKESRDAE